MKAVLNKAKRQACYNESLLKQKKREVLRHYRSNADGACIQEASQFWH